MTSSLTKTQLSQIRLQMRPHRQLRGLTINHTAVAVDGVKTKLQNLRMGSEIGFLRKYFVIAHRFDKKPGFLVGVRPGLSEKTENPKPV